MGFWCCIILVPGFAATGIQFAIFKEKMARFVSGFNSLSKREQELYDKAFLAKDMRNASFLWAGIMLIGALASLFSPYCAIVAYVSWIIVFFKDVHLDPHKAFEKYLMK